MIRNIFKIMYITLIIGFFNVINVRAIDEDVPLTIFNYFGKTSIPIFSTLEDGTWFPGISKEKSFYIKNKSKETYQLDALKLETKVYNSDGTLMSNDSEEYKHWMEYLSAAITSEGKTIYEGNIENLVNKKYETQAELGINSDEEKKMTIKMTLGSGAGSIIQGGKCEFDIILSCSSEEGVTIAGNNLTRTGFLIDSTILIVTGIIMILLGMRLFKKKTTPSAIGIKHR